MEIIHGVLNEPDPLQIRELFHEFFCITSTIFSTLVWISQRRSPVTDHARILGPVALFKDIPTGKTWPWRFYPLTRF